MVLELKPFSCLDEIKTYSTLNIYVSPFKTNMHQCRFWMKNTKLGLFSFKTNMHQCRLWMKNTKLGPEKLYPPPQRKKFNIFGESVLLYFVWYWIICKSTQIKHSYKEYISEMNLYQDFLNNETSCNTR